jgi:ribose transport system permease protein
MSTAVTTTSISVPGWLPKTWAETRPFRPVLFLLIGLFILLSITQPGFLTPINISNALTSMAVLWMVAMGATFVLLTGGIDLSSGAIAALAGIGMARVLEIGIGGPIVVIGAVLFGALVGAISNGLLVGLLGLNVFVVTLASMTALTGVVNLWSNANSFFIQDPAVIWIATGRILGIPVPIILMVLVLVVFWFIQGRTYFGRDMYAVGGSMKAAKLSGIRTARTHIAVYAIAGGMSALAGVIMVGRIGAATPQPDNSLPLIAIAAILLGGTALAGGSGSVIGTALGVLFIGFLQNGLSMSGVPSFWQQIVTGVILVIAVLGDRLGTLGRRSRGLRTRMARRPASVAIQPVASQKR